jgi:light-regulated signal transduction histidine kinase (bacteriophytochrome)
MTKHRDSTVGGSSKLHMSDRVADRPIGAQADLQSARFQAIGLEKRARVFEPCYTTKPVGKGTGQGLALAHTIGVKKHRGQIWLETESGRSTTLFVGIPFDASSERAMRG